jgi:hypothetical protein
MDDGQHDDAEGGTLLYVKSTCLVCLDKTWNCHYCNGEGTTYIEAADKTVARWISNLTTERKGDILEYIQKGLKDGKRNG